MLFCARATHGDKLRDLVKAVCRSSLSKAETLDTSNV